VRRSPAPLPRPSRPARRTGQSPPARLTDQPPEKIQKFPGPAADLAPWRSTHRQNKAIEVTLKDGEFTVIDGPFTEAKELVGGWALMECRDRDEVIEWTKRFLSVLGEGESRVRPAKRPAPARRAGPARAPGAADQPPTGRAGTVGAPGAAVQVQRS